MSATGDGLLLADSTRLLHIGPPKTATTVVQSGFHQNREAVAAQGVHYAGSTRQPMSAARSVAMGRGVEGVSRRRHDDHWPRLLAEVEQCDADRVVISSEFFADADTAAARRIIGDLSASHPVHVVVTLRSLARILPSQWQQFVQARVTTSYQDWLHDVLDDPPPAVPRPGFWRRHRHDLLVRRWADAVGPENLTVVVVGGGQDDAVLHTFEDLVGLCRGTLRPAPEDFNRSLTADEVALVRALNDQVAEATEIDAAVYNRLVRFGLCRLLVRHPAPVARHQLVTPRWAVQRAQQIGADAATSIGEAGVRVIGDLSELSAAPVAVGEFVEPASVDVDTAARALSSAVMAAARNSHRDTRVHLREMERARRAQAKPSLDDATMRQIVGEVRRRLGLSRSQD